MADPETRQFKLDETDRVVLEKAAQEQAALAADSTTSDASSKDKATSKDDTSVPGETSSEEEDAAKAKKKKPGKLPRVEEVKSVDTQSAAADTLRKFFNRR